MVFIKVLSRGLLIAALSVAVHVPAQVSFVEGIEPLEGVIIPKSASTNTGISTQSSISDNSKPISAPANTVNSSQNSISQNSKATNWPKGIVKFVVPFAPGGTLDQIARTIAEKMSPIIGQPVIVENKPGAGGMIGSDSVAKSQPDGYTLLFTSSVHALIPSLNTKLSYDPIKDFRPVALLGTSPLVIVTSSNSQFKSIADLLTSVKQKKGVNFGSSGSGSLGHLSIIAFSNYQNIQSTHIPYKGEAPILSDLMDGKIDFAATTVSSIIPFAEKGWLRPLAVMGEKRIQGLPEVPTLREAGLGLFQSPQWFGIFSPSSVPDATIMQINQFVNAVLADPQIRKKLSENWEIDIVGGTPDVLQNWNSNQMKRWNKVIRDNKIDF